MCAVVDFSAALRVAGSAVWNLRRGEVLLGVVTEACCCCCCCWEFQAADFDALSVKLDDSTTVLTRLKATTKY